MKPINPKEWKKYAKKYAEIFVDYPLYKVFFGDISREKMLTKAYYFFCFECYETVNYTYTDENDTVIATVLPPNAKLKNNAKMFLNPIFSHLFILNCGIKASKLGLEYFKFCDNIASQYIQKDDYYIKNIGVDCSVRGQGKLKQTIIELCKNNSIFLETHCQENVDIYTKLGFNIVAQVPFHGLTHTVMRREKC